MPDAEAGEIRLDGTAVSRGVAVGRALRFYGTLRQYSQSQAEDVDAEIDRFTAAVSEASEQLRELIASRAGNASAAILEFHQMMLENSELVTGTISAIYKEKWNAEWALKLQSERLADDFLVASDAHLREKASDLRDVTERVQSFLAGSTAASPLPAGTVILASEIHPSTLIALADTPPAAIVTEQGGWTSHAFIIARELQIPAVAGARNVLRHVRDGDEIMVDGDDGKLIVRPSKTAAVSPAFEKTAEQVAGSTHSPFVTTETADGKSINVSANAESPENIRRALEAGASGIGLLRSEYLFDLRRGLPDFATQLRAYSSSFAAAGGRQCRIRTFDIPADRLRDQTSEAEKNPALGLHGVRYALLHEEMFRIQLSAILEAGRNRSVEIVLPLISGVDEVRRAREILSEEALKAGVPAPRLGGLIEVPAAVLASDLLLKYLDFACIGTNDLVQYMVAADRDNDAVAASYQTLHPAVLRSLKIVLDSAQSAGKAAVVCGEIAGSPFYTALLIGLGFESLSMNVNSIARVLETISALSSEAARDLAEQALGAESAADSDAILTAFNSRHLAHLRLGNASSPR